MAAAIINIQMGGGTREPFIGVREPKLPPSHIISEGVVKGIGPYASKNTEGERTDVDTCEQRFLRAPSWPGYVPYGFRAQFKNGGVAHSLNRTTVVAYAQRIPTAERTDIGPRDGAEAVGNTIWGSNE